MYKYFFGSFNKAHNHRDCEYLKNECDEAIYEFKTAEYFSDETFEIALKQEKFKQD